MDALVPAFILALLLLPGDPAALATARLASRTDQPFAATAGAGIGIALGCAIAAAGGAALRATLTPEAQRLMLAMALVATAIGLVMPAKPHRIDHWRLGAFGNGMAGIGALSLGGSVQFLVLALALVTGMPASAAAGATLATMVVLGVAAFLGEAEWRRLPATAIRRTPAPVLLVVGAFIGLGALRLV
jgi:putative Ca2+/H+ antiporter (TMEM165/GDT1 family)